MCLAIPGTVETIDNGTGMVNIGGVQRPVGLTLVPDVKIGDYVIVHAGFAIQILDPHEAEETLNLLRELAEAVESARIPGRRTEAEPPENSTPSE
jgi:hydrogenase expression/formation protein HypC